MQMDRRQWLRRTLTAAGALVGARVMGVTAPVLSGCSGKSEPAETSPILRVPLDAIPDDGRHEVLHKGIAVEFRREDGQVVALSLMCSHQLCRIEWQPDDERYFCPCHDGVFAADGSVIYGPPKRPLRRLTVTIEAGEAVVDVHEVYRAAPRDAR